MQDGVSGSVGGWLSGWMDGQMDGRKDGWIKLQECLKLHDYPRRAPLI